jgi:hypothetical protein
VDNIPADWGSTRSCFQRETHTVGTQHDDVNLCLLQLAFKCKNAKDLGDRAGATVGMVH